MGYTHYWYQKPGLDPQQFESFLKDVDKVIRNAGVELQHDFDDEGPVQVGPDEVWFNGKGDAGHETFVFKRDKLGRQGDGGEAFTFCKTAQKPYDLVVCTILIAAKKHFGDDIKVTSDGDETDWVDAIELADRLLGYTATLNADDRELEVS
jgi:hypothetical protein